MSGLLDVALILLLLVYLVAGYRRGLIRSLGSLAGIALGAVAASLLGPVVAAVAPDATVRVIATIGTACVLILLGHALGAAVGALLGRRVLKSPLGVADRVLGAGVNVAVAALVVSVVAAGVAALGVPMLAQPIASSAVLRTIDAVTPAPLGTALAAIRTTVLRQDLPDLGRALGAPVTPPSVPRIAGVSSALRAAQDSVVKVTGTASACGQDQSGSGFVVAPHRVLTNAHVLAGVRRPVVVTADGSAPVGSVVAFDVHDDLALIAVPGLHAKTLKLGDAPAAGDVDVVNGYPFGGPFSTGGAAVISVAPTLLQDVAGPGATSREVVTLAADVEQGDSGGPLLTSQGRVAGIVFAKSSATKDVGYAMAPQQFASLVHRARTLTAPVSSGACVRG